MRLLLLITCILLTLFHRDSVVVVSSFSLQSSFMGVKCCPMIVYNTPRPSAAWTMRDHSASTRFTVGDRVRVVASVVKAGTDLIGSTGTVLEVWEKCDVDPTCCCAEQVDEHMAVRVEFNGGDDATAADTCFTHYFAEEELASAAAAVFDGMTCTTFKVEALGLNKRKRGIASYDPNGGE